ncbi:MAG TPA: sulfite exporter TauE/SafE family protein [Geminicoccus sp.]|jgi:hypothetical protein|uniref:sulfite exporter TauE/SafE family protein n=1 Tax=Geminicoccus sp. TaxID=2024832 RepID=UPI002E3661FF|nr:sulfite exporter TauE/SafE family protein [Geminicoccus sp.]HEX2529310.1 sulfite exporter TauE/SafE family protein [Geminicoccus sp.]
MAYDPQALLVAVVAGLACGFLNTVASSGSAVSLPILLALGLDPISANATNRIPVLLAGITASADLARRRVIPWRLAMRITLPVTAGAVAGAMLAEAMPAHDLRLAITFAVLVALILLLTRLRDIINAAVTGEPRFGLREAALFVLVGLWLGFIVLDGATYLLLALVFAVRLPLVQANAVKNVLLVPTTFAAMLVFASHGSIDWTLGLAMGLGSMAGGLIGARVSVSPSAKRWIFGLLVAVIVGELIHLTARYAADLPHSAG